MTPDERLKRLKMSDLYQIRYPVEGRNGIQRHSYGNSAAIAEPYLRL